MAIQDDLDRIQEALVLAGDAVEGFLENGFEVGEKSYDNPVTEADLAVDTLLKEFLPQSGDGWLSEETADDERRLGCSRVWVVDPIDGTKEFVLGIPEWCISIGLVVDGYPVAGGIFNPMTKQLVLGAAGHGVTLNGEAVDLVDTTDLSAATVLASNSEIKRGEWDHYAENDFHLEPTGSVAYKLGLVAARECEATWTLVPKHEWDVAAGAALVEASGGKVFTLDWERPVFNQARPKLTGMIASVPGLAQPIRELLQKYSD